MNLNLLSFMENKRRFINDKPLSIKMERYIVNGYSSSISINPCRYAIVLSSYMSFQIPTWG